LDHTRRAALCPVRGDLLKGPIRGLPTVTGLLPEEETGTWNIPVRTG
jgi:hypothetical protein